MERQHLLEPDSGRDAHSGVRGLAWRDVSYEVRMKRKPGERFAPLDAVTVTLADGSSYDGVVASVQPTGYGVSRQEVGAHVSGQPVGELQFVAPSDVRPRADKAGWKTILRGISGEVQQGRLCAIMGPSGAGKTSLLNILAGRVAAGRKKKVTGGIQMDGAPIDPVKFRSRVAYVMQEDSLLATQTPREALEFSAALRTGLSPQERERKVASLLDDLRLTKCQNTFVGNQLIPGVSGGEKKRTAIGVELIADPDILFLDEPTSGLDSYAAHMIVDQLRRLAHGAAQRSRRTVVCTIHQPSSEVFGIFDDVILISAGRVVYQGRRDRMPAFFEAEGYGMPPQVNPADHVMFVMQTEGMAEAPGPEDQEAGAPKPRRLLADAWAARTAADADLGDLARRQSSVAGEYIETLRAKAGMVTQFKFLGMREGKNVYRDTPALVARFGTTIFINLIVGFVFKGSGNKWDPLNTPPGQPRLAVANHFGGLAQLAIGGMFGLAQPLLIGFPIERPVFLREYATGSYGAFPYFVSKLLIEIPLTIVQAAVMYICTYWVIELQGNFAYLTLGTALLGLVAASTALIIGAAANDPSVAIQLSPLLFVPQILFSGFFIRTSFIPSWLRWAQYLCSLKYGTNLIAIAEFRDPPPEGYQDVYGEPNGLFPSNDIHKDKEWVYVAIMVGVFIAFRLVACAILAHKAANLAS